MRVGSTTISLLSTNPLAFVQSQVFPVPPLTLSPPHRPHLDQRKNQPKQNDGNLVSSPPLLCLHPNKSLGDRNANPTRKLDWLLSMQLYDIKLHTPHLLSYHLHRRVSNTPTRAVSWTFTVDRSGVGHEPRCHLHPYPGFGFGLIARRTAFVHNARNLAPSTFTTRFDPGTNTNPIKSTLASAHPIASSTVLTP